MDVRCGRGLTGMFKTSVDRKRVRRDWTLGFGGYGKVARWECGNVVSEERRCAKEGM